MLDELERNVIVGMLEKYQGNVSKTAEALGLRRQALQYKLDKYKIQRAKGERRMVREHPIKPLLGSGYSGSRSSQPITPMLAMKRGNAHENGFIRPAENEHRHDASAAAIDRVAAAVFGRSG
ncbi:hypothetical protein LJK87_12130 [Paenibacillus sp. P25]|nr:hypothetical protein LJK87_12130 [Paenibacillus sp. P25]